MCDAAQTISPRELAGVVQSGRVLHAAMLSAAPDMTRETAPVLAHQA